MFEALSKWVLPLLYGTVMTKKSALQNNMNAENLGHLMNQAYTNLLSNYDPLTYQNFYKNSFLSPIQNSLREEILPKVSNQFLGGNERGSSALNQALKQSILEAAQRLGSQWIGGYQNQQQLGLNALQQLLAANPNTSYYTGGALHFGMPLLQEYIRASRGGQPQGMMPQVGV